MCLDATRWYAIPGHFLNDAQALSAILKPFRPLFFKGKLRVAFLATRNIKKGEELTWDYSCPPENQQWLMRRKTKRQGNDIKQLDYGIQIDTFHCINSFSYS